MFFGEKNEDTEKLFDLLKVTKGVGKESRNSGQISWTHCPMLNPPYFTLSMVCNLLWGSSHSDVLFGKGCFLRKREPPFLQKPSLPSSQRGAAFLVMLPLLTHRDVLPGGALSACEVCSSLTYAVFWYGTSVDSKSEQMVLICARPCPSLQTVFLPCSPQTLDPVLLQNEEATLWKMPFLKRKMSYLPAQIPGINLH